MSGDAAYQDMKGGWLSAKEPTTPEMHPLAADMRERLLHRFRYREDWKSWSIRLVD
jgi:hypothetical protein